MHWYADFEIVNKDSDKLKVSFVPASSKISFIKKLWKKIF